MPRNKLAPCYFGHGETISHGRCGAENATKANGLMRASSACERAVSPQLHHSKPAFCCRQHHRGAAPVALSRRLRPAAQPTHSLVLQSFGPHHPVSARQSLLPRCPGPNCPAAHNNSDNILRAHVRSFTRKPCAPIIPDVGRRVAGHSFSKHLQALRASHTARARTITGPALYAPRVASFFGSRRLNPPTRRHRVSSIDLLPRSIEHHSPSGEQLACHHRTPLPFLSLLRRLSRVASPSDVPKSLFHSTAGLK